MYQEELQQGMHSEEEAKRQNARSYLERYTHYYERYHAHDVARRKARDDGTQRLPRDVQQLVQATHLPEGQLRFLFEVRSEPDVWCWSLSGALGVSAVCVLCSSAFASRRA